MNNTDRRTLSLRPRQRLGELARKAGCQLFSVGDIERLAGVNTSSEQERRNLWGQFRHLYSGPTQVCIDTVMDYCADIAIRRIEAGELCLVETRG